MFVLRKREERHRARELRAEGLSLGRIATKLGVAKSSVSVWVRDVAKSAPDPPPIPPGKNGGRPRGAAVVEGPGKTCGRCRRQLTLDSFNRAGDGRQEWCRDCFSDYFRERGSVHLDQVKRAKEARMLPGVQLVRERLQGSVCADCGEGEIAVLEFDHCLGEKRGSIARMLRDEASLEDLLAEMDKCEIVCANCHRRRTAERAGWARTTGVPGRGWALPRRRNFEHVMGLLASTGCVDCGERDPVVLEFDHVGAKRYRIAELMHASSLERLEAELAACEVRCSNCHRLITYIRRGGVWRIDSDWAAEMG